MAMSFAIALSAPQFTFVNTTDVYAANVATNISYQLNDDGTVSLSWSKADNASSYTVLRSTSRFGNYASIGTTSSTSFVDANQT